MEKAESHFTIQTYHNPQNVVAFSIHYLINDLWQYSIYKHVEKINRCVVQQRRSFAILSLERTIRKPTQCAVLHHSKEPTGE